MSTTVSTIVWSFLSPTSMSTYMRLLFYSPTLDWMALRSDIEGIFVSSSCFSSSWTRAESLPHFRHSKIGWGLLHKKHEYFLSTSSFSPCPLSPNVKGLSRLGDLSRSLSPSLSSWLFLPHNFEDSLLNSMSDSEAAIADERSCTPCLFNRRVHRALPCLESPRVALGTPWHTPEYDSPCGEGVETWP